MIMASLEHGEGSSFTFDSRFSFIKRREGGRGREEEGGIFGCYRIFFLGVLEIAYLNVGQRTTPSVILRDATYLLDAGITNEL